MSRPLKPIKGEPLGAFFMREFCSFARRWPDKRDLEKLSISFAPNGYPLSGRADLLPTLFRAAAFPGHLKRDPEATLLLLALAERAPVFVWCLLGHLADTLRKASPHRRRFLLTTEASTMTPKAVKAMLQEAVDLEAVKKERTRLRRLVSSTVRAHAKAVKGTGPG